MNISNLIKIAWKALLLNKMRAFLTMLGVIIGVASVITMLAIGEGSKTSIQNQISGMGSNMITIRPGSDNHGGIKVDDGSSQKLTMDDLNAIKKQATNISDISPFVASGGRSIYGSKNWPTQINGVYPDYFKIRKLDIKSGSLFNEAHERTSAKVVVIGQTIVDNLFGKNENPIGKMIRFNKIPFQIIGVLEKKGQNTFGQDQDNIILAPFSTIQKRVLAEVNLQSIIVSAKNEQSAVAAVDEITSILRTTHKLNPTDEDNFRIFSMDELLKTINTTSEMLTMLLVAIASISLLIGGIGIMNIMYVSVKERTREIGLRMAVGGKGRDILMQFLTEAIFISITGGVIGVLLGLGATTLISSALKWPVFISFYSIVVSFCVCAFTGIFFGWYPARKASNLDPITALRYE
jgi:putative ABC transport system permease protein